MLHASFSTRIQMSQYWDSLAEWELMCWKEQVFLFIYIYHQHHFDFPVRPIVFESDFFCLWIMWRKTVTCSSLLEPGKLLVKWLGYRLDDQESGLDSWRESDSPLQHPDWPWGMKLTTHLHLLPRLRMHGAISPVSHVFVAWCIIKLQDKFTFLVFIEFW